MSTPAYRKESLLGYISEHWDLYYFSGDQVWHNPIHSTRQGILDYSKPKRVKITIEEIPEEESENVDAYYSNNIIPVLEDVPV